MKVKKTMFSRGGGKLYFAFAGLLCASATWGAIEYAYDDDTASERVLIVTVTPKDTEETLDLSYLAPEGATVTNITKKGEGTLYSTNTASTAYTFSLLVEEGIFKFDGKHCIGKRPTSITVCDGATLWNAASASNADLDTDSTVYVKGRGLDDKGVLRKSSYNYGSPFSSVTLTGDSYFYIAGVENGFGSIDFGGHDLEISFEKGLYMDYKNLTNPGNLIRLIGRGTDAFFAIRNWTRFYGDSTTTFALTNAYLRLDEANYIEDRCFRWTVRFDRDSRLGVANGSYGLASIRNSLLGPIVVNQDKLKIFATTADRGLVTLNLPGAISGGGLHVEGKDTSCLRLHLGSTENTFTNGLSGIYADIVAAGVGSIPSAGGDIALTNSTLQLRTEGTYALPSAEFSGSGVVSNGFGRWRQKLVKDGTGTLTYKSSLGANLLDVRGGGIVLDDVARRKRVACAGLIEGVHKDYLAVNNNDNKYSMLVKCIHSATDPVVTNRIVSGMRVLYEKATNESYGWWTNRYITYSGYVWNNTATNQMWAFAGTSTRYWRLNIDGNFIMGYSNWYGSKTFTPNGSNQSISTNLYEMTPGYHFIEYRTCCYPDVTSYVVGCSMGEEYMTDRNEPGFKWVRYNGLMYNDQGKCTKNIDDYKQLIDPGDGSVFTACLPDEIPDSIGETVFPDEISPVFSNACFAAGTSLALGGSDQTFGQLSGWPNITGGDVTVTGAFTMDGATATEGAFSFSGALAFAPGARLSITADRPAAANRDTILTLGTATGGISGNPSITVEPATGTAGTGRWRVWIDGDSIKGTYMTGLRIYVR